MITGYNVILIKSINKKWWRYASNKGQVIRCIDKLNLKGLPVLVTFYNLKNKFKNTGKLESLGYYHWKEY